MELVDSHCHVISDDEVKYPRAPLGGTQSTWASSRPLTAEQFVERMDSAGVAQAVLVQATTAYGYDNSYVLDSCRRFPDRFVGVGTFDPLPPAADERLAQAIESGLSGVRLFTTGSTMSGQAEWFADPETFDFWSASAEREVTVCLQMRLGDATPKLESILERFPGVTVLLDHCGYPDIAAGPAAAGAGLAQLGRHPGLHLKLTHRSLEPLHDAGERAREFLDPVLEGFGSNRIAWGSNCPAAEQSMGELVDLAKSVLGALPAATQADIFSNTSRGLYRNLAPQAQRPAAKE